MAEVHDPVGDATLPPTPPSTPETPPTQDRRFTPKRLVILFVVTLAALVGGTWVANALFNNNSSTDQAMGDWMSSYGSHYLAVLHDFAAVSTGTDATSVRAACIKLQGDVGQAQSDPAMPLSSLESQWSVILSNLATATDDCVKGIDQKDSNLINTAQSHMNEAGNAYVALIKAVKQAGG